MLALQQKMVHCNNTMPSITQFPNARGSDGGALSILTNYGVLAASELAQVNRVWTAVAKRSYSAGVNGGLALLRCRTPQDLIAAQAAFVCDELELLRGGCSEISDIVAIGAAEAVRLIGEPQELSGPPS